jgi:hypothetical protein
MCQTGNLELYLHDATGATIPGYKSNTSERRSDLVHGTNRIGTVYNWSFGANHGIIIRAG